MYVLTSDQCQHVDTERKKINNRELGLCTISQKYDNVSFYDFIAIVPYRTGFKIYDAMSVLAYCIAGGLKMR